VSSRLKRLLLIVAAVAALGLGGAALAAATAGDDDAREGVRESAADDDRDDANEPGDHDDAGELPKRPVDGTAADRARSAAVVAAGGGSASEVERTDERDGYKVQVERRDGERLEVHLDRGFGKVSVESDAD
jgi:Ni/Co efflux regulator RcnB